MHGAGARAPVRLVYYDDASSPARAAANAERLLDADAVEVLIGPYASDLTRAVLPVARGGGRVLWNHGGASDDIHMAGGRAVGILTPVSRYFGGLIELARSLDRDAARVALLHRRGSSFGHLAALGVGAAASDAMFVTDVITYSSLGSDLPERHGEPRTAEPGPRHQRQLLRRRGRPCPGPPRVWAAREGGWPRGRGDAGVPAALGTLAEGFLGPSQWEPRLAYVPDFGPGPDEVTQRIRARVLRPTTRPPRPTPPV